MKVAQVVRRFSFDEWGGTENVVWNSTLALRKLGIESEILATSALSLPGEEVRDGVRIRRFRYFYPYFPLPGKDRLALDKKGGSPYSPSLSRVRPDSYPCRWTYCDAGGRGGASVPDSVRHQPARRIRRRAEAGA